MKKSEASRPKRIVIIGGVAGGASAAVRARRLDERAEIVMVEKGAYVSFANCGLPYHVGGQIAERDKLLLNTPDDFRKRFAIDVRIRCEATAIDPEGRTVTLLDHETGKESHLSYDSLILSPGAEPIVPPFPGVDLPGVFTLWTMPDMDAILSWIREKQVRRATVIGAGFVGLELAEAFRALDMEVAIVEREDQVLPTVDKDMASLLHQHLLLHGVRLELSTSLVAIEKKGESLLLRLDGKGDLETDLVILSVGVRPRSELARKAGLALGLRGAIKVDTAMKTSADGIWAVGDAIEVVDPVSGKPSWIPLAGPANLQGRIAADGACGRTSQYRGTIGSSVCKVFDLTVAATGLSERRLKEHGIDWERVVVHPASHAGYYPGAAPLTLKLLYAPESGAILGAQAVGAEGVDKRIDIVATAMAGKLTVEDLEHLELCYAPPYGSAKDAVNMAGFVAANMRRGDHFAAQVEDLPRPGCEDCLVLDVRTKDEHEARHIPGDLHIPLNELRDRLDEIPRGRKLIVYCGSGYRSYVAHRILRQRGFEALNLVGGFKYWAMCNERPEDMEANTCAGGACSPEMTVPAPALPPQGEGELAELDACGLQCPGPLMQMQKRIETMAAGDRLAVKATDPGFPADAAAWCRSRGHELLSVEPQKGSLLAMIRKGAPKTAPALREAFAGKKRLTAVVFSGDLDRAMAAFIIANGAAAMGMETTLFFTFWGLNVLRKADPPAVEKGFLDAMFGAMMPRGAEKLSLSKMNMAGMGTAMMKHVMAEKKVATLPQLIENAREAGVRIVACTMSMDVMGLRREELIDGVEEGGVAAYLESAGDSTINLFI